MGRELSNSAQFSQFDACEAPLRVVLLGASNLTIMFPTIVESARATFARPLEFFVALGYGRSYGQESRFFQKNFSGILQSDLWPALDAAPPRETVALVSDIGNDLAYEAPVDVIVAWIESTLDRLAAHEARAAIGSVPIASVRAVGAVRYAVLRRLLFPRCGLSRGVMMERAEALTAAVAELADQRKTPVFSGEKAWYGLDPIHPRRASAGAIWQRLLGAVDSPARLAPLARPQRRAARAVRRVQAQWWSQASSARHTAPVVERLDDRTTIALF